MNAYARLRCDALAQRYSSPSGLLSGADVLHCVDALAFASSPAWVRTNPNHVFGFPIIIQCHSPAAEGGAEFDSALYTQDVIQHIMTIAGIQIRDVVPVRPSDLLGFLRDVRFQGSAT